MGFPGGSDGKESACNAGDLDSIPGLGRSPRGGHGNLLQYSCLENPHGQRSLVGYSPWGHKESDTTEWLSTHTHTHQDFHFIEFLLTSPHWEEQLGLKTSLVIPPPRQAWGWIEGFPDNQNSIWASWTTGPLHSRSHWVSVEIYASLHAQMSCQKHLASYLLI